MAGSCEHGDEPSGSIKYWEFPEQLSDYQLLKDDSASWSYLPSVLPCCKESTGGFPCTSLNIRYIKNTAK
jgi:hypothetical protein